MSFDVVVDELRGHASHLDGLMDRLNTAVSAANTVSMSDDAYGLLCSFLPPIVNPMEQEGIDSITAASEAVGTTAGNVRMAADYYEESDTANAQPFAATLSEAGGASASSTGSMANTAQRATSPFESSAPMAQMSRPMAMSAPVEASAPMTPMSVSAPMEANAPMTARAMSAPMEPVAPMAERAVSARLEPTAPMAERAVSARLEPTDPS